jgi:hypothetical protein
MISRGEPHKSSLYTSGSHIWVVERHLRGTHDGDTAALWWDMVDRGGMHDTMLRDFDWLTLDRSSCRMGKE